MESPIVSVVIPCYNQAEFLPEAIESVITQSYPSWECILVDDGSTDNTASVIEYYLNKDSRIKSIKKENGGLVSARNEGIKAALGKYILPLDGDDKIASKYLQFGIDKLEKDSDLKVVYCRAEFFGARSGAWALPDFSLAMLAQTNLIFCSAIFKKSDWVNVGGYDPQMKYGLEDWEFWINLLKDGKGRVHRLDYVGFFYRIKAISMFSQMSDEHIKVLEDYISAKHSNFIISIIGNPIRLHRRLDYYQQRVERIERTPIYRIYQYVSSLIRSKR
ncbi:MAG: glycosyltransferase family 2 protein [Bacteroidetes bacterium]|nr:glycosyltransferase family 2 protein [Bacteroidota bacterium]